MQIVPGHSDGENKNEKLAVVRQPRARPALVGLRRAEGRENRIADAMDAIVSVISRSDDTDIEGELERIVEARMVNTAKMAPLARVSFTSPTEHVSGDAAAENRLMANVGKGGCRTSTETVSAM